MLAAQWDTCRMNLRKTRVPEQGTAAVGSPYGSTVGCLGVSRKIEHIRVPSRRQNHHVGRLALDLAVHEVPGHNAARSAIDDHNIEQLPPDMHCHRTRGYLLFQCLISPEQELLSGLTSRVKRSLDLYPAKRSRIKQSTIFSGKRHALGDALVNDVQADLGETIYVGLTGAEVAALYRVLKQAENAVAVVTVILSGINPPLSRDRVCAARSVMIGKAVHVVALLAESGSSCGSSQARAYNDNRVFPAIG